MAHQSQTKCSNIKYAKTEFLSSLHQNPHPPPPSKHTHTHSSLPLHSIAPLVLGHLGHKFHRHLYTGSDVPWSRLPMAAFRSLSDPTLIGPSEEEAVVDRHKRARVPSHSEGWEDDRPHPPRSHSLCTSACQALWFGRSRLSHLSGSFQG